MVVRYTVDGGGRRKDDALDLGALRLLENAACAVNPRGENLLGRCQRQRRSPVHHDIHARDGALDGAASRTSPSMTSMRARSG